jgi:ABC-type multidrug transport system permease subunit
MLIAALPDAQTAGTIATLMFSMTLIFNGVFQPPQALPGFWSMSLLPVIFPYPYSYLSLRLPFLIFLSTFSIFGTKTDRDHANKR